MQTDIEIPHMVDDWPDTLSGLLEMALEDFKWALDQPDRFTIDMSDWHRPPCSADYRCSICLAGAVLAHKGYPDSIVIREDVLRNVRRKMNAIDLLRTGDTWQAYGSLFRGFPTDTDTTRALINLTPKWKGDDCHYLRRTNDGWLAWIQRMNEYRQRLSVAGF